MSSLLSHPVSPTLTNNISPGTQGTASKMFATTLAATGTSSAAAIGATPSFENGTLDKGSMVTHFRHALFKVLVSFLSYRLYKYS